MWRLANVEHETIGVSNVAARNGCVLFLDGATSRDQPALFGLNVGHEKLKDGPVFVTIFDVEAEGARLEAHERWAPVRDGQAENRSVKRRGLVQGSGSDNDIT
jgi:hypothetical protein